MEWDHEHERELERELEREWEYKQDKQDKQEVITKCDEMREKLEGCGLSDALVQIIEFAYGEAFEAD